jgi:hypothetical protein
MSMPTTRVRHRLVHLCTTRRPRGHLGTFLPTGTRWDGDTCNRGQRLYLVPYLGIFIAITAGNHSTAGPGDHTIPACDPVTCE